MSLIEVSITKTHEDGYERMLANNNEPTHKRSEMNKEGG